MDITDLLPILGHGIRKLFDPGAYDITRDPGMSDPGYRPPTQPNGGEPTGGLDDNVAQITKMLLDRLNQPDQNVERMKQLYDQYPVHEKPSIGRRIGAGFTTYAFGPEEGHKYLNAPFDQAMSDWAGKAKQAKDITEADTKNQREEFGNAIRGIGAAVGNQKEKDAAANEQAKRDRDLAKLQQDLELANNKLELAKVIADNNKNNQQNQTDFHNAQLKALETQRQIDNLLHQQQMGELVRNHDLENAAKDAAGWSQPFKVKDPNDPTQEIQMSFNLRTGQSRKLTADDQVITGDISKPLSGSAAANSSSGGQLTQQTKAMMEGSKMLYPHIAELRKQAADLDKRGLFGPVMSRVRDIAAKVGTTGDPGKVSQDFQNLATAITNDRNMPNDAAVGQFLTTLGLVASGAGRVHGGARGGGSIQMVNYMKSLLSSDSTLSMFNGRLNGLDSFIKGYAAGPTVPKVPTGLDKAIEDVLKGVK